MKVFRLKPPKQKSLPCAHFLLQNSGVVNLLSRHPPELFVEIHKQRTQEPPYITEYNDGDRPHEDPFFFMVYKHLGGQNS